MSLPDPASLDRRLGPLDASAIVISNVIGVGIFTTPGVVASMVPSAAAMLAVWAFGGALAFAGALAYAELAAWRPQAGGEYVYLRESFGSLAGFLTGWTSFVAGFSGAIAFGSVAVAGYLDRFIPGAGDATVLAGWHVGPLGLVVSVRALVAITIIVTLALVQVRGVRPGRLLQNSLTTVTVGALVAFVVAGLIVAGSAGGRRCRGAPAAGQRLAHRDGAGDVQLHRVERGGVRRGRSSQSDAQRADCARAGHRAAWSCLYLALNTLYLRVVPRHELIGAIGVGEIAAGRLFGSAAASMFAGVAILIILSSLSAWTLAGPRIYFAMARDGVFLPSAARVHPRYRTPAIAIFAQTAWSALLVLSGTFEQLLTYTGFSVILFSALAVLSLFFVRIRGKDTDTFRAWGYPWAPAIFCLVSFTIVANTIVSAPGPRSPAWASSRRACRSTGGRRSRLEPRCRQERWTADV